MQLHSFIITSVSVGADVAKLLLSDAQDMKKTLEQDMKTKMENGKKDV
jgi:hypothetical protein